MNLLPTNPMPRMTMRARIIIETVMAEHRVCHEDFYSFFRDKHLVEARATAAQRLTDVGYTSYRIAQYLRRNHTTVLNYLPKGREIRRARYATKRLLRHLTPEAQQIVLDYARCENVKPELLIATWVNERAQYESDAKARAAA